MMNFVRWQVLLISALHIWLREVMFVYGAVEKIIGGGFIPSRFIKLLVPDKGDNANIAVVLLEAYKEQP
jgi:hypothetical protein